MLGFAAAASADNVSVDSDVFTPGVQHSVDITVAPGGSVSTAAQTVVAYQGSKHLVPGSSVTMHKDAVQGFVPGDLSVPDATGSLPATWDDTSQSYTITSPITFTAPAVAGSYQTIIKLLPTSYTCEAGDDNCLSSTATSDPFIINLTVSDGAPTNTAPTVAFATAPGSTTEGSTVEFAFSITDPDLGDSHAFAGSPDCGAGNSVSGTPSISGGTGTFSCTFPDGLVPAAASTVSVQVTDGIAASNIASTSITVSNVNPDVAAPTFSLASVNCRTAVTLSGLSFTDPGVNDATWSVDINWGDGSTDTTTDAATQGGQPSQTHTYTTPGNYTASVTVTDKDGGANTATSSTNSIQVLHVYNTTFLQPFDGSSPSKLITNTMKSGRVVPVKAAIFDVCTDTWVPPTAAVTMNVGAANVSTPPASDAIESYADAGASSANTNSFRWTADSTVTAGGFWIYNLDSKALALQIGKTYRLDVRVDGHLATGSTWALLTPVK